MTLSKEHQSILKTLQDLHARKELEGSFDDIPIEVYHNPQCPGISSTQIKTVLNKSVLHLQHAKEDTDGLMFGRLFHSFISEPHLIQNAKSNDLILAKKMYDNDESSNNPIIDEGAKHEITFFSYDKKQVFLKCRADGFNDGIVFDFKTTRDASLGSFLNDCKRYNYRISAAYYLEVISEVLGLSH